MSMGARRRRRRAEEARVSRQVRVRRTRQGSGARIARRRTRRARRAARAWRARSASGARSTTTTAAASARHRAPPRALAPQVLRHARDDLAADARGEVRLGLVDVRADGEGARVRAAAAGLVGAEVVDRRREGDAVEGEAVRGRAARDLLGEVVVEDRGDLLARLGRVGHDADDEVLGRVRRRAAVAEGADGRRRRGTARGRRVRRVQARQAIEDAVPVDRRRRRGRRGLEAGAGGGGGERREGGAAVQRGACGRRRRRGGARRGAAERRGGWLGVDGLLVRAIRGCCSRGRARRSGAFLRC